MTVLEPESPNIMFIEGYTSRGFTVSGDLVVGPCAILPRAILQWNVSPGAGAVRPAGAGGERRSGPSVSPQVGSYKDITHDSLSLFRLLEPRIGTWGGGGPALPQPARAGSSAVPGWRGFGGRSCSPASSCSAAAAAVAQRSGGTQWWWGGTAGQVSPLFGLLRRAGGAVGPCRERRSGQSSPSAALAHPCGHILVAEILVLGTGDRVERLHPAVLKQMRVCGIAVEVQDTVRMGCAQAAPQ